MQEMITLMRTEWMIAIVILVILFIKLGKGIKNGDLLLVIQLMLLATIAGIFFINHSQGRLFDGMFLQTPQLGVQKGILLFGVYLLTLLCHDWLVKSEHLSEFLVLMLSSFLGMCFLISSDNMLMFYLSLEMASIPVAAMANFDLEKKKASEAAMKMILSSALASGILLFGISIIYGLTGSLDFAVIWGAIRPEPVFVMGFVFLFSALAFKLSVIPFHFWTADVYQGSSMPTTAYLSVISKGVVAFSLISILYKVFPNLNYAWFTILMILSVITIFIANLFALRQSNIKRFLAFSSIAQVGFVLLGITGNLESALSSVTFFIFIYILSNLAVFGVATVLEEKMGITQIDDLKGLFRKNRFLGWMLSLGLFSLAGIPPTAGFFGKLFLLISGASNGNYWFVGFAALNMIISLYYYLKITRSIFSSDGETTVQEIQIPASVSFGLYICAAGIIVGGMFNWIYEYISGLAN